MEILFARKAEKT